MAGVGVWGGDTFIRKFLLGNLPSTLNTSELKYLTCKYNYLSVAGPRNYGAVIWEHAQQGWDLKAEGLQLGWDGVGSRPGNKRLQQC